jgi:oligopeptide/dipeptide ABC transporter ATP-binding protein
MSDPSEPALLHVEHVAKSFERKGGGTVRAVDDVSFTIAAGETLGLIGESGSGKSTVGRLVLGLLRPEVGRVTFMQHDLNMLPPRDLRRLRSRFQVVFQEPLQSLNPRRRIGWIVEEPLIVHEKLSRAARQRRLEEMLDQVGLSSKFASRYPHDLSGGEQQRVGIARALITNPSLVVLDEPTSSLDLSVRALILNLLATLQAQRHLSYLFISHDIATVQYFCTRTAVMYLGRLVEVGPTRDVLDRPAHPYTKALLSATLPVDPMRKPAYFPLTGDIPDPAASRTGCPLVRRCPIEITACSERPVPLLPFEGDRAVACIRASAPTAGHDTARVHQIG